MEGCSSNTGKWDWHRCGAKVDMNVVGCGGFCADSTEQNPCSKISRRPSPICSSYLSDSSQAACYTPRKVADVSLGEMHAPCRLCWRDVQSVTSSTVPLCYHDAPHQCERLSTVLQPPPANLPTFSTLSPGNPNPSTQTSTPKQELNFP